MCGLVGLYSSNFLARHKDVLSALLYLDTWRGRDSTGVAAIRHNADTEVLKATIPGYEFVEGPKLDQHLRLNDFCWIGHNRYGTVGKNIKTNAHPFTVDDEDGGCLIVGAHNGTLKNKYQLTDHMKFGTDSEALFNEIALSGVKDAIGKVEGAWALTWYDHLAEEFRVLRNSERTLFYAWEEGRKTLIWASEIWMIRVATSRAGVKLDEDKIYAFNEDTLYRFPAPMKINDEITLEREGGVVGKKATDFFLGERGGSWLRERFNQAEQAGAQGAAAARAAAAQTRTGPPVAENKGTAGPNPYAVTTGTQSSTGKDSSTPKKGTSTSSAGSSDKKVVAISDAKRYKGFNGVLLSENELKDQLANGCGWCELEFVSIDERFAWLADGKPVCRKCLDGDEDKRVVNPGQQQKTVH